MRLQPAIERKKAAISQSLELLAAQQEDAKSPVQETKAPDKSATPSRYPRFVGDLEEAPVRFTFSERQGEHLSRSALDPWSEFVRPDFLRFAKVLRPDEIMEFCLKHNLVADDDKENVAGATSRKGERLLQYLFATHWRGFAAVIGFMETKPHYAEVLQGVSKLIDLTC